MYCVGFYTIPYIQAYIRSWHTWPAQKEATSCTRFYIQNWRWIGNIFYSDLCEPILLHGFLRWYLYLFKISCRAEVVTSPRRSVTATPGLTSDGCHLTHLVSDLWSDAPKVPLYGTQVHLYGTYLGSLWHSPPWMKNQHGLNEGKNLIGKKIISQLSACDVTRVISLNTNNQA